MDISCAFATSPATPGHIQLAEDLGYRRAWCYDSPALYPDVWMTLALAAVRTSSIGLGPAVLVPSLRHPMVNAAAIATLAGLAPGRVGVAVGVGFTGRYALGQPPMRWADAARYVEVLQALLHGDAVPWEGAFIKMIHPAGFLPERPLSGIPILLAAEGPKGRDVVRQLGDGVMTVGSPPADGDLPPWRAVVVFGTVLDSGETLTDSRVIDAAGHAVSVAFHARYERGGADAVDELPGGRRWRQSIEKVPKEQRHLAIHEDHLVGVTQRDRPSVIEGAAILSTSSITGGPGELRDRIEELAAGGATEVAYQPAGPDIRGELERFMAAMR
jgi:5,10-methylenetetrahydromethanopterin reductase